MLFDFSSYSFFALFSSSQELIEGTNSEQYMTFKQDHSSQTSPLRSALWSVAYEHLKPDEWKKLALLWKFTEPQIKAIETQWTGKDGP